MPSPTPSTAARLRRPRYAAAPALLALATLAGCGGGGLPEASGSPTPAPATTATESPTPSADPTAYAPVPDGVELTATGSRLDLGEEATAAWTPRQDLVGVVDVAVTGIEQSTLRRSFSGFDLSDLPRRTTPYFVTAEATDVGETDLGGRALPLFGVDDSGRLVEATTVPQRFDPCPRGRLPAEFRPDDEATTCLVFLLPPGSTLEEVAFVPPRPTDPITWSGDIDAPGRDGGSAGSAGEDDDS